MNNVAAFYHQRMILADLAAGRADILPLPSDALERGSGGAALGLVLSKDYPEAIILTTGPYTGSFSPASGHMTATLPSEQGIVQANLTVSCGSWLRQSGFDVLVIMGKSAVPCIIRCFRGECFLEDAGAVLHGFSRSGGFGIDDGGRPALRAELLRRTAEGLAGLILADSRIAAAGKPDLPVGAGSEYGSLPGGYFVSRALQAGNVLALCMEGGVPLPPVPIPVDNPLRQGLSGPAADLGALLGELDLSADAEKALSALSGVRRAACRHCPSPCLAWIAPKKGRHLLMADHAGLAVALEVFGKNAPLYLDICDINGLDPVSALQDIAEERLPDLPGVPQALRPLAGAGQCRVPAELSEDMRIGLILGVCPRLIRRFPSLNRESLPAFLDGNMRERILQAKNLIAQRVFL